MICSLGPACISLRTHQHSRTAFYSKVGGSLSLSAPSQMEVGSQDHFQMGPREHKHRHRSLDNHHPKYTLLFGEKIERRDLLIRFFFSVCSDRPLLKILSLNRTKTYVSSHPSVCTVVSQFHTRSFTDRFP